MLCPCSSRDAEPPAVLRKRQQALLVSHRNEEVVADWHEDLMHSLACLGDAKGRASSLFLRMRLVKLVELDSTVPHNALSEAEALMRWDRRNDTMSPACPSADPVRPRTARRTQDLRRPDRPHRLCPLR